MDDLGVWRVVTTILVDQLLVEAFTLAGFIVLLRRSASRFGLDHVEPTGRGLIAYGLSLLPILIGAAILITPISQTLRFGIRMVSGFGPRPDASSFVSLYALDPRVYLVYAAILVPLGAFAVATRVTLDLIAQHRRQKESLRQGYLPATRNGLDARVATTDVYWITVHGRVCNATCKEESVVVPKSISMLDDLQIPGFVRINRSTIVNIDHISGWSHWENGKYIVRMSDPDNTTHVVPRGRVRWLKENLATRNSAPQEHRREA
ncbi:MAG: LytTR family DNA-binding domain-containing protein [Rhodothermales bacterium]